MGLSPVPVFAQEVGDFLRALSSELRGDANLSLPFPAFYADDRKLVIHCISPSTLPTATEISYFAHISDTMAEKGLKIIHLWEDVWRTKQAVVQSRLRAAFGQTQRIPARLTKVRRIDKPTFDRFIQDNHLQVTTTAKYKYGLFLPKQYERIIRQEGPAAASLRSAFNESAEVLVAAASFSGGKSIIRDGLSYRSFELIRFSNRVDCTVVGGLDKLLKAFIGEVNPDDIMTYADRDWSDGRSYERLGFERIGTTPPQTFWVNPQTWERYYAERLTETQISKDWLKIVNAGNWKFLKKRK